MRRFKNLFKYHIYISIIEFFLLLFPNIKLTYRIRGFFYKPLFKECGKNLQIAKNVTINMYRNISKKIIIGEGSWIAGNSTIILGVEIGIGNIIAAGSVVTKNTENFSLYAGAPAKFIKELK